MLFLHGFILTKCSPKNKVAKFMMVLHIPNSRVIRLNVSFVIIYADFIMNFTNVMNATNFNRLFSGKP